MYLPGAREDFIQNQIISTGNWFEWAELPTASKGIRPGDVIFDLGSNIGNHALYWALKFKAKKIYAFEPVPPTFSILATNIALNGLENTIVAVNAAVSNQTENLSIQLYTSRNSGGTELRKDTEGTIKAISLDEFEFPEQRVDYLKIYVEDFECHVIQGGMNFLRKYRPPRIWGECRRPENFIWMNNTLRKFGYRMAHDIGTSNYIWHLEQETSSVNSH
jgi:FkbM family methyltransferase